MFPKPLKVLSHELISQGISKCSTQYMRKMRDSYHLYDGIKHAIYGLCLSKDDQKKIIQFIKLRYLNISPSIAKEIIDKGKVAQYAKQLKKLVQFLKGQ